MLSCKVLLSSYVVKKLFSSLHFKVNFCSVYVILIAFEYLTLLLVFLGWQSCFVPNRYFALP